MKIIEPSATLIDEINPAEILRKLEVCGRVSHQSQPREDGAENFVRMLIKRGHESVLEHVSLTFHIICNRAIMAELTRHRLASFTVESTRYCNYSAGKFGGELTFIKPEFWSGYRESSMAYRALDQIEKSYRALIEIGVKPENARDILPNCLKSELYMTANLREWRHILKLRTDPMAHPQMRKLAGQILDVFNQNLPVIVEDIVEDIDYEKIF